MSEVLIGDRTHRQLREIDLVRAAEVEEQIERPFEVAHTQPEAVGRQGRRDPGQSVSFTRQHAVVHACFTFSQIFAERVKT
jgi:hypothetical protein